MSGFLDEAVAESRSRIEQWRRDDLLARLPEHAATRRQAHSFSEALRSHGPIAVIAEIKRSSPSLGRLADGIDPAARAAGYVRGGAAAVSVLTESRWFGGSLEDLKAVRGAIDAPILRKDFLIDEYDLAASRAIGADAVLLIVAALGPTRLGALLAVAASLQLEALVEIHDENELSVAINAGARMIGVNARNLRTLEVDVDGALVALRRVPPSCTRVFESGIKNAADVQRAQAAGAHAVLVGETLMRSADPRRAVAELLMERATR